jgi:hypothetical protein
MNLILLFGPMAAAFIVAKIINALPHDKAPKPEFRIEKTKSGRTILRGNME